jgi:hypothetical protein
MEPVLLLLPNDLLAELTSVAEQRRLDAGALLRGFLAVELPELLAELLTEPIDAEADQEELPPHDASNPEVHALRVAHPIAVPQRIDHGERT